MKDDKKMYFPTTITQDVYRDFGKKIFGELKPAAEDENSAYILNPLKGKNEDVQTNIWIKVIENKIPLSQYNFTYYDEVVLSALFSFRIWGITDFTAQDILRFESGKQVEDDTYRNDFLGGNQRQRLFKIEQALDKLSSMQIKIDWKDEFLARKIKFDAINKLYGIRGKADGMVTHLAEVVSLLEQDENKNTIRRFMLSPIPTAIEVYCQLTNRVAAIPTKAFGTIESRKDSEEYDMIMNYVVRRVYGYKEGTLSQATIRFEDYNRGYDYKQGAFAKLGLDYNTFETIKLCQATDEELEDMNKLNAKIKHSWNKRKATIINEFRDVLEYLKRQGIIENYENITEGANHIIVGVKFFVKKNDLPEIDCKNK